MTVEELKVIINAETAGLRSELNRVKTEVKSATSSVNSSTKEMGNGFSGLKRIIAGISVAAIAAGLYKLGKEAVTTASDLVEVQNVVDTAFGSMANQANGFAKSALDSFGMSELTAKRTSSTFMAMAKGMNINGQAAANMSLKLTGLSGDMASFYNVSQDTAATALKSVFTGETEALKQFGVVMTENNLKAFAMKNGMSSNIQAMDQASQTTLRYMYVMNALNLAQGDFAKTSNTWANQTRILKERFVQLLGIIGSGLMAALLPAIRVLNIVMSKLITFANVIGSVFSSLFGKKFKSFTGNIGSAGSATKSLGSGLGNTGSSAKKASSGVGNLNKKLGDTSKKAKAAKKSLGSLASFDNLNVLSSSSTSGSSGTSGGGSGGTGSTGSAGGSGIDMSSIGDISSIPEPDTSGVDKAVDKVKKQTLGLVSFLQTNRAVILSILAGITAGFIAFDVVKNWSVITGVISTIAESFSFVGLCASTFFAELAAGNGLVSALSAVFGSVVGPAIAIGLAVAAVAAALVYLYNTSKTFRTAVNKAVANLVSILSNLYNSVIKPLFSFLADVFNTIVVPLATFIAKVVVSVIGSTATILLSLWNNILAPLANFFVDILAIALQGVIDVWNAWKPAINNLFTALNWIWNNILSPLAGFITGIFTNSFKSWGTVIGNLIPGVKTIFRGLVTFFTGVFTLDIGKALTGIRTIFSGLSSFLSGVFKTDWTKSMGLLGVPLNAACTLISGYLSTMKGVFNGIVKFVSGVFSGDWKKAWQGVKDIFSSIVKGFAGIFKSPINAIIDGINSFLGGLNKIKIPKWVPGVGGKGFDIPKIPHLATGAVVNKATYGVFGEASTEAVIPLERNTRGLDLIASKIVERMPISASSDGNRVINLCIELVTPAGSKLAKWMIKNIKEEENKTGKPVLATE